MASSKSQQPFKEPFKRLFKHLKHCCRRIAVALLVAACAATLSAPAAQANILGQLRDSIASLWSQKAGKRSAAQSARARARSLRYQAETLHDRLERTQQALQRSNETYYALWRQMRQTEAQIVEARHRVYIVTARYNRRRILFGRRLAAMQRSGRLSYLQMFLGSRTLSDLTRRSYLFETVTKRDAELQAAIRRDKRELETEQAHLMAQWHHRNRVQLAANRERERIVLAEREQQATLKKINASRYAQLSYALAQEQSSRELEAMIGNLAARRASIVQSYEAEREQQATRTRWYSSYSSDVRPRYANYRSGYRYGYRRGYYRTGGYRRRGYRRYRRSGRTRGGYLLSPRREEEGGFLKPMTIRDLIYQDNLVPENRTAPRQNDGGGSPGGSPDGGTSGGVSESGAPGGLSEGFSQDERMGHYAGDGHDHRNWQAPVRGRLASRFGMRYHPILRRRKLHTGTDLAARRGTPIKAAHDGRVLWSGWKKAYGKTVIIDDGRGTTTVYGHASKLSVRAGQPIKRGEYIGNVGSTGWSTGAHLHFEVRKNGKPVDPSPYLRGKR